MHNQIPLLMSRIFNTPLMIHEPKLDIILWALRDRLNVTVTEPATTFDHYSKPLAVKAGSRTTRTSAVPNVAVIPVHDTLVHRHAMMQSHSGMTSYLFIRNTFREAMASDDITAVILHIDSPGGESAGVRELAEEIYAARGRKPIYAVIDEHAFSAAYYLAAASDRIYVPKSAGVGSIGVIAKHINQEKYNEKEGYKITSIYAGARKNDFSPHGPLSEEAYNAIKSVVDSAHDLFTGDVARYRKLRQQYVKGTEAALYFGEKAIAAKLADEIGNLDDAIRHALKAPASSSTHTAMKETMPPLRAEQKKIDIPKTTNRPAATAGTNTSQRGAMMKRNEETKVSAKSYPFECYVGLNYMKGLSKRKAVEEAKKQHPDLFFDYVERVKAGGPDHMVTVFNAAENELRREYLSSPELQREFGSADAYKAYRRAVMEGRAKIYSHRRHITYQP